MNFKIGSIIMWIGIIGILSLWYLDAIDIIQNNFTKVIFSLFFLIVTLIGNKISLIQSKKVNKNA